MTAEDISEIQTLLDSTLPKSYIEFILSGEPRIKNIFYDRDQVIEANLKVRKKAWSGEPFDRLFYVFGRDEDELLLFLDLDIPAGAVMRQDNNPPIPSHRAKVLSLSFEQWKNQQAEQGSAHQPTTR